MISKREFITLDIIENNMTLPWDWEYVNGNPNITIDKTQEEHTPKLFSDENNHADDQSDYYKEEEVSERLFDQDVNEEEDFEIPAFLRRQKF